MCSAPRHAAVLACGIAAIAVGLHAAGGCSLTVDLPTLPAAGGGGLSQGGTGGVMSVGGMGGEGGVVAPATVVGPGGAGGTAGMGGSGGAALSSYAKRIMDDGPESYWRLGDAAGSGAAFDSMMNVDGLAIAEPTFGVAGAIASGADTACGFGGAASHITMADVYDFKLVPFTIEVWFMPTTIDATLRSLVSKANVDQGFDLAVHATLGVRFFLRDGGAGSALQAPDIINVGEWSHIVVTNDLVNLTLYVDGLAEDQKPAAQLSDTSEPFVLGRHSSGSGALKGSLDEVAVYARALTPIDVAEHYALGLQP